MTPHDIDRAVAEAFAKVQAKWDAEAALDELVRLGQMYDARAYQK